jgi:hypothetical protein
MKEYDKKNKKNKTDSKNISLPCQQGKKKKKKKKAKKGSLILLSGLLA